MKRVLVLAGLSNSPGSTPYSQRFSEYIKDYDFHQTFLDQLFVELSPDKFEITETTSGQPISGYDLVMIREYSGQALDLAFVISKYLKNRNIRFFNQNYLVYRPLSKIAQAVLFYEQKVNFPATYFSLDPKALIARMEPSDYPIILKDRLGMHGSDNYLVKSKHDAAAILQNSEPIKFIAQEYLPNSHDYRVLVMGAEEPLLIKRVAAAGSHLNNTSQGGKGSLANGELPDDVINQAKQLTKVFGIDVGGVDVLQSQADGRFYFLEVNNQPQLVMGAEVAAKMDTFKKYLDGII